MFLSEECVGGVVLYLLRGLNRVFRADFVPTNLRAWCNPAAETALILRVHHRRSLPDARASRQHSDASVLGVLRFPLRKTDVWKAYGVASIVYFLATVDATFIRKYELDVYPRRPRCLRRVDVVCEGRNRAGDRGRDRGGPRAQLHLCRRDRGLDGVRLDY